MKPLLVARIRAQLKKTNPAQTASAIVGRLVDPPCLDWTPQSSGDSPYTQFSPNGAGFILAHQVENYVVIPTVTKTPSHDLRVGYFVSAS
jgi:hypothetical protein